MIDTGTLGFKADNASKIVLILVFVFIIFYCVFLQFISPVLYGEDSYYHAAVSGFIKDFGFRYKFHWAQLSLFKDFFSDKDFLFHLLAVPFFYFSKNIILAAKLAVIFYNILFLLIFAYILRKYLPNFLTALFLLFPFFSYVFTTYFLTLRSVTLANILTIAAIYLLINKKWIGVLIVSLLYPLAHISFLMLIIFSIICEVLRYLRDREFYLRNIYIVILGVLVGCFLHPNFPNNLLSLHLNFFLVPIYSNSKPWIDFGNELFTPVASIVFIDNFAVFFTLGFILWMAFWTRIKVSLSTLVWWAATLVYLLMSFFSNRHWYITNVLFFVFFASYISDWLKGKDWKTTIRKIRTTIIAFAVFFVAILPITSRNIRNMVLEQIRINVSYENIAYWMKYNIPAGQTIYHTFWYDSPYFICLNPKNDYLVVLDPIYFLFRHPKEYLIYRTLALGKTTKPYEVIRTTFNASYGFCRYDSLLYQQIQKDNQHFTILYKNDLGIVFKVLT
jgi:hypothetical protein